MGSSTGPSSTPTTGSTPAERFFGHFLKGEDNGWGAQPKVQFQVRHAGGTFVERGENEWPGGLVRGLGTHQSTFTGVGPFRHNDSRDRPAEFSAAT